MVAEFDRASLRYLLGAPASTMGRAPGWPRLAPLEGVIDPIQ